MPCSVPAPRCEVAAAESLTVSGCGRYRLRRLLPAAARRYRTCGRAIPVPAPGREVASRPSPLPWRPVPRDRPASGHGARGTRSSDDGVDHSPGSACARAGMRRAAGHLAGVTTERDPAVAPQRGTSTRQSAGLEWPSFSPALLPCRSQIEGVSEPELDRTEDCEKHLGSGSVKQELRSRQEQQPACRQNRRKQLSMARIADR
jgi:hypothetical protein